MFVAIFFAVVSVTSAQHQQEIDPAYLRQYYAQQQAGGAPRATPIFEQQEQPQQYVQQAAPVRSVSWDDFTPFRLRNWRVVSEEQIVITKPFWTVPKTSRAATAASLLARTSTASETIPTWTGKKHLVIVANCAWRKSKISNFLVNMTLSGWLDESRCIIADFANKPHNQLI